MSDDREIPSKRLDDDMPSMEAIAGLDAFLDGLVGERRPPAVAGLNTREVAERMLAAQLRLAREGVEEPTPEFLEALDKAVTQAVAKGASRKPRLSRTDFLRSLATLAGGAGLGVAGIEGVSILGHAQAPRDLVAAGNDRWYDVAAVAEVPVGGAKPFSAGGVMGYLFNNAGQLHAVSGICTHMGCRLKPTAADQGTPGLRCLCHGSRFDRRGEVVQGLAPSPLPRIALRVGNGRVYALGTEETV